MVTPCDRKDIAAYLGEAYQVSITRACKVACLCKSMYYYEPTKDDSLVISKLQELAEKKPNEGQDKLYARLRQQGYEWNYKRVRRVYLLMGLNKRRRIRKRLPARDSRPLCQTLLANETWSMDFMHDTLANKRRFRTLNIIDDYNREALNIEAEFSFSGYSVVSALKRTIHEHGKPKRIRVDNGPEFISSAFTDWCGQQGIEVQYIPPGKPSQNGYIERFNRTYRQDVLNAYLFEDMMQVRILTEEWMEDYNKLRPHEALNNQTPLAWKMQGQNST